MNDNNLAQNGKTWHDSAGKFAKSNPGKPKGSSKNKLRDEIKSFLNDNWKEFPKWFAELKPKEKIETMLDLLPYGVARLQSISVTDSDGNDFTPRATIDWTKLSPTALKEVLSLTSLDDGNET